jgi:hypothetical protein
LRRWLAVALTVTILLGVGVWQIWAQVKTKAMSVVGIVVEMPGETYRGALPALTLEQKQVRDRLKADLTKLAVDIGERNSRHPVEYAAATSFMQDRLTEAGFQVRRQTYEVKGRECVNLEAELKGNGRAAEIIVIGAHYDSAVDTPGANDNGSGAVALLALADLLKTLKPDRTLRFVAFANEEPPYFQTDAMGSLVYAKVCRQRGDKIVAMLSLETMGYYDDTPKSQKYPPPFNRFYPDTGNFIAFVGDTRSAPLVKRTVGLFRKHAQFPSEGGAAPAAIEGIGWSDHWSFWQCGYQALMVTDTAPFRYPHYHQPTDTVDKVDFDRLARVVVGLRDVTLDLVSSKVDLDEAPPKKLGKFK